MKGHSVKCLVLKINTLWIANCTKTHDRILGGNRKRTSIVFLLLYLSGLTFSLGSKIELFPLNNTALMYKTNLSRQKDKRWSTEN